jgi:hypothetical protein
VAEVEGAVGCVVPPQRMCPQEDCDERHCEANLSARTAQVEK